MVFSLNRSGVRIWRAIEERLDLAELIRSIAAEHSLTREDVRQDVFGFLTQLHTAQLITLEGGSI